MKINTHLGYIDITKKTIADIAGKAAMECYGLVGMAHQRGKDGLIEILTGEQANKGVGISVEDNRLIIDLFVIVEYATKISVVAENIISNVKYNVEKQSSLSIKRINVNVVSVRV